MTKGGDVANLQDYVRWRGDITLAERGFNVVDALVLTALSNIDLTGTVPGPGAAGVRMDAVAAELPLVLDNSQRARRMVYVPPQLLADLGASARFADTMLSDYVDLTDVESGIQFSAVTFHLPDGTTFVSFRGTDTSIVGWREDFTMSFEIMPSQPLAAEYLRDRVRECAGPVTVGGHSKGGNLALYAAMRLDAAERDRIHRVYDADGPGLSPQVADATALADLAGRLVKIVPEFSVIGAIFDARPPTHIVASAGRGLLQHDIMTWQVQGTGLVEVAQRAPEAELLNRAVDGWLDEVDYADRKTFTDALFSALAAGGATLMVDVPHSGFGSFESVLFSLLRNRSKTRRPVRLGLRAAWRALTTIDYPQLARQRATIRAITLGAIGVLLMVVPTQAVQIMGSFAIVALSAIVAVRALAYYTRFRRRHQVTWPWVVAAVALFAATVASLILLRGWMAPANILLGAGFLLYAYASARRGLPLVYQRPRRRLRATLLFAGAVCSFGFGVVALSHLGLVSTFYVLRAGNFLTLAGAIEGLFVMRDRMRGAYAAEKAAGYLPAQPAPSVDR
ncbi:MAG: Mbeg1-like protein [Cellulomonadaceae bacterium]